MPQIIVIFKAIGPVACSMHGGRPPHTAYGLTDAPSRLPCCAPTSVPARTSARVAAGALVLVAYGVIPTLQPEGATFSRVYAVYGGIFIVMAYGWGWVVDGDKPDTGDFVGAAVALAGVTVAWFWPR